jgi:hypothetical protein
MIKMLLGLFRSRQRVPVIEIPGYVPEPQRSAMLEALKKGEPLVLEGGARLRYYERTDA